MPFGFSDAERYLKLPVGDLLARGPMFEGVSTRGASGGESVVGVGDAVDVGGLRSALRAGGR